MAVTVTAIYDGSQNTVATSYSPFSAVSIPAYGIAFCLFQLATGNYPTIAEGSTSGWNNILVGLNNNTGACLFVYINNTNAAVNVTLNLSFASSRYSFVNRYVTGLDTTASAEIGATSASSTAAMNPPNKVFSSTKDWWVLAVAFKIGGSGVSTGYPSGYSNTVSARTITTVSSLAWADKEFAGIGSEDPGSFTGGGSGDSDSFTIGFALPMVAATKIRAQFIGL